MPIEIQLYLTLGLCAVTIIVLGGFVIIQFINEPMGFVYSLIFNNPVSVLSNEMLNEAIGFANFNNTLLNEV